MKVIDQCVLFPKKCIYTLIQVTNTLSCHGDGVTCESGSCLGIRGACSHFHWKTVSRYHDGKSTENYVLDAGRKGISTMKEELVQVLGRGVISL